MSEETKKAEERAEPTEQEAKATELSEQNLDEVAAGRAVTQNGIKAVV